MKLWVSKNSDIPVKEQLATQLLLAILSGYPAPGSRLPSTRSLSLRLRVHSNTIGAVFRDLQRRGWLEYRRGSGFYVAVRSAKQGGNELVLDQMICEFFEVARSKGFKLRDVRQGLERWISMQAPDHFLLIESDPELRSILEAEMQEATGFPVCSCSPEGLFDAATLAGAQPVFLFSKEGEIRRLLPPGTDCLLLHGGSIERAIEARLPIPPQSLIAILSRWPEFLRWSQAVLVAAGASSDALLTVDARRKDWRTRIRNATAVITDTLHGPLISDGPKLYVVRLLSDDSRRAVSAFVDYLGVDNIAGPRSGTGPTR
ncbi:MAG TPA: GntR family transcriptional regulator [Acidobacteriota bacterium]|nr:GntR family transcriptional regulator [Acidobacteriota bacterium]